MEMIKAMRLLALLSSVLLSACASTSNFSTTWKAPDAMPLEFKSQKVVAIVLIKDPSTRRLAEDRLAQQIAAYGAQGRPLYSMLPDADTSNEKETRAALEAAGVKGAIVMRPIAVDRDVKITEPYEDQSYASFWGGYYGYGMSLSFSTGSSEPTVSEKTTVYVETLVYSLKQNKLVWGGRSKTVDPDTLAELIQTLSKATVRELKREKLVKEE
jgi:hypothetical protein